MVESNNSTGKTYSIWMDKEMVDALNGEADTQGISKSKVVRAAVLRYVDEMNAERAYNRAMEEARGRKYD